MHCTPVYLYTVCMITPPPTMFNKKIRITGLGREQRVFQRFLHFIDSFRFNSFMRIFYFFFFFGISISRVFYLYPLLLSNALLLQNATKKKKKYETNKCRCINPLSKSTFFMPYSNSNVLQFSFYSFRRSPAHINTFNVTVKIKNKSDFIPLFHNCHS